MDRTNSDPNAASANALAAAGGAGWRGPTSGLHPSAPSLHSGMSRSQAQLPFRSADQPEAAVVFDAGSPHRIRDSFEIAPAAALDAEHVVTRNERHGPNTRRLFQSLLRHGDAAHSQLGTCAWQVVDAHGDRLGRRVGTGDRRALRASRVREGERPSERDAGVATKLHVTLLRDTVGQRRNRRRHLSSASSFNIAMGGLRRRVPLWRGPPSSRLRRRFGAKAGCFRARRRGGRAWRPFLKLHFGRRHGRWLSRLPVFRTFQLHSRVGTSIAPQDTCVSEHGYWRVSSASPV